MRKFMKVNVIGLITLACVMYAGTAFAEGCNEESPNHFSQGEDYFNLDLAVSPSDEEKILLGNIIKSISGEWVGKLTELECVGSADNTRQVLKESDVSVEINEGLSSALLLNYEAYNLEEKKTSIRSIDALGGNDLFSLEFFEKDGVSFSEKSRRKVGDAGDQFVEYMYDIHSSGKNLTVSLVTHVNGFFVSSSNWVLTN